MLAAVLAPAESRHIRISRAEFPSHLLAASIAGDNAGAAFGLGASTGDVVPSSGTSDTVFGGTDVPTRDETNTVTGFADAAGSFLPLVANLNVATLTGSSSHSFF